MDGVACLTCNLHELLQELRSAREGTLSSSMSAKLAPPANSERSMW